MWSAKTGFRSGNGNGGSDEDNFSLYGMIKNNTPRNKEVGKYDTSHIKDDDIVLLVDGDWLAFTSASNEMERFIEVHIDGVKMKFPNYGSYKSYLKQNNRSDDYGKYPIVESQYNHPNALSFAKSSCKKKLKYAKEKTKATKVIIFCGSSGNFRAKLPLPELKSNEKSGSSVYKGQRGSGWIPETLIPLKAWLQTNWLSYWAVDEEADDSLIITKNELYERGVEVYLRGVDKDFLNEHTGGLFVSGHHEEPIYKYGTPEDKLGEFYTKKNGTYRKPCGGGDKFLCYQMIVGDDADHYLPSAFIKEFGTLGRFGIVGCEDFLSKFNTRKELWQGMYDFYVKYLPPSLDYTDCFGVEHKGCTPLYFLDLYYKCAKMRDYAEQIVDVRDVLSNLDIEFGELHIISVSSSVNGISSNCNEG